MKFFKSLCLAATFILIAGLGHAADLAGHWTSEFDSQIGPQKYTYDFSTTDAKTTGKANYDHSMGKGEAPITNVMVKGDEVSFTETVDMQGTPLIITYKGKFDGDQMQLTRQVGDYGSEQIVAKRAAK